MKELHLSAPKRRGRGRYLAQPSAREKVFKASEETPDSQGKTRSIIPKYALYSPAMHCWIIQKNRFPHGVLRWQKLAGVNI